MATIEPSLFDWRDVDARSDLDRFDLARDHLPDARLLQYLEVMRGAGRDDYPVGPMWNALIVTLREQLKAALPDSGRHLGYDGKAIESHSTGRVSRTTGAT